MEKLIFHFSGIEKKQPLKNLNEKIKKIIFITILGLQELLIIHQLHKVAMLQLQIMEQQHNEQQLDMINLNMLRRHMQVSKKVQVMTNRKKNFSVHITIIDKHIFIL